MFSADGLCLTPVLDRAPSTFFLHCLISPWTWLTALLFASSLESQLVSEASAQEQSWFPATALAERCSWGRRSCVLGSVTSAVWCLDAGYPGEPPLPTVQLSEPGWDSGWLACWAALRPEWVLPAASLKPMEKKNKSYLPSLALGCWAPGNGGCVAIMSWVMGHDHSAVQSLTSKNAHAALSFSVHLYLLTEAFPWSSGCCLFSGVCRFQCFLWSCEENPLNHHGWPKTAARAGIW